MIESDQHQSGRQFTTFRAFFKRESTGGLLLFVAAVMAMLLKNSP